MKSMQAANRSTVCRALAGRGGVAITALAGCLLAGAAAAAPTPIRSVPYTISQPGNYQLTQNLTYTGSLDAILITASNVTLEGGGYTLTGPGVVGAPFLTGIHVRDAASVTITGVRIAAGFANGIFLDGASNSTLSNNSVSPGCVTGILLSGANSNNLVDNTASGSGGIKLVAANHNVLTGNNASGSPFGQGIFLNGGSSQNTLHGNVTDHDEVGILLNVGPTTESGNLLDSNIAEHNTRDGIDDDHGTGNILRGNQASFNGARGIFLDTTSGETLSENQADGNQVGILLSSASFGDMIEHNTAQGNTTFDLEDDNLSPCVNDWAYNLFVTDNEQGSEQGPMFGCIR